MHKNASPHRTIKQKTVYLLIMNELIFLIHSLFISFAAVACARFGKEALMVFISLMGVCANLFVTKQILLGGFTVTAADAFTIGAVLALNLLQEYYGTKVTLRAIWISFSSALLFTVLSQIHLWYIPAECDTTQTHFFALLCNTPRLIGASLCAYLVSQHLDRYLFSFLKNYFNGNFMIARFCSSTLVAQLADTLIFSFLGLAGLVENLTHIVVISYLIKLGAVALTIPALWAARFIIHKHETHESAI